MKYATWKLNFTDPKYGTGPEEELAKQGVIAEGAIANGEITSGGIILGYLDKPGDYTDLTAWAFTEISQVAALEFAKAIDASAEMQESGRIGFIPEGEPNAN